MPSITVKNIPQELYNKLKIVAALNHRSINNEMINCLESVLMPQRLTIGEKLLRAKRIRNKIDIGKVDANEIKRAIEEGRP
jgi:plasmid stability protein